MRKDIYRRLGRDLDLLATSCWCGCSVVEVSAADVKAGRTLTCGRRLCDAMGFTDVMLTADGDPDPEDCRCREPAGAPEAQISPQTVRGR